MNASNSYAFIMQFLWIHDGIFSNSSHFYEFTKNLWIHNYMSVHSHIHHHRHPHVAPPRPLHGPSMAPPRPLHGPSMDPPLHGPSTAPTWPRAHPRPLPHWPISDGQRPMDGRWKPDWRLMGWRMAEVVCDKEEAEVHHGVPL